MEKEKEHTKFIILRFDNYINGANTKGNFLLAFNTFLCGGIISNYKNIIGLIEVGSNFAYANYCLVVLLLVSIITSVLIIKAVYPFLVSGNSSKDKYHSHLFFNAVAEFNSAKEFCESYNKQTDKEVEADLAHQAFHLAQGLRKKYNFLEWAMRLVYVELVLLTILITILIIY